MPRGVPLTPAQTATIVRVFAETGSYADAGRAADVAESVARRVCLRRQESDRVALHASACERAMREAREGLRASERLIARVLGDGAADPEGLGLEPKDIAALVNARAGNARSLAVVQERHEGRAEARLRRDKLRAEARLIQARLDGTLPADKHDVTSKGEALALAIWAPPEQEP